MNNDLQVFDFNGAKVRTLLIDDEPYFVGKDVATVLGYSNSRKAIKDHVDAEDKGVTKCYTPGGEQNMQVINESGMYSLVLSSKLPQAKEFKHWVTSEVLPTIRKHGAYATPATIEKMIADPDFAIKLLQELKSERKTNKQLKLVNKVQKQQINELQPKVSYYDTILASDELLSIGIIAKDYGMSAVTLNKLLNKLKVQYKCSGVWLLYAKYQDKGYTKTYTDVAVSGCQYTFTKWTQKGRLFLYELLKRNGCLPLIEQNN